MNVLGFMIKGVSKEAWMVGITVFITADEIVRSVMLD